MAQPDLSEILGFFPLQGKAYQLQPIKKGLINDTYLVSGQGQPQYILQHINAVVFSNISVLMGNLQQALPYLAADDYAAIKLVKTREGDTYLDLGEAGCWRLMTYIPGSTTSSTTTKPQTAYEAGRIIGRFHTLLQDAPAANFKDSIPGFHDLDMRIIQFQEAKDAARAIRKDRAQKAIEVLQNLLMEPFPVLAKNLPVRICHNDTKLNNILFSEATRKALCLIDLDTLMKGHFLYDFGDAVRTIVNTAPEDERVLQKIHFSKPLFDAFVDGLAACRGLLSIEEVASLPLGALYMPLLHGMRALIDYLNDDAYYQVAYEGQNLDRSLSLLTFAQRDYMKERVMEKLITG